MNSTLDEGYTVLHWNSVNANRENVLFKDLVNHKILIQKVAQYLTYM